MPPIIILLAEFDDEIDGECDCPLRNGGLGKEEVHKVVVVASIRFQEPHVRNHCWTQLHVMHMDYLA